MRPIRHGIIVRRVSYCQGTMILAEPPVTLLRGASLFLDFDGTLVGFADQPMAVEVGAELPPLLERLHRSLDARVAILTGRALGDLDQLLPGSPLEAVGGHGAEWRHDAGPAPATERGSPLDEISDEVAALQARWPGVLTETKAHGLALHFRNAPAAEGDAHALAERIAARLGLKVQHGKMVVEVRPAATDKGTALTQLMRQPPYADGTPLFVGDDLTDEAGFAAARDHGGAGLLVGPPRATEARFHLPDVAAVLGWLDRAEQALA